MLTSMAHAHHSLYGMDTSSLTVQSVCDENVHQFAIFLTGADLKSSKLYKDLIPVNLYRSSGRSVNFNIVKLN